MATDAAIVALLQAARARRAEHGLPSADTDAYRLVHGAADGFPDVTLDVYGAFVVASVYTDDVGARDHALFRALLTLGFRGVYLKHRPRQANRLGDDERKARAPSEPICGESAPDPLLVRELGVPYPVRLGDGLSTGIFLDQRENRARLMREAAGARVLNLFAYTCAFGLVAARGGALSTTNIDVARPALERGRALYTQAGVPPEGHRFLLRDVLDTLPRMARAGEAFEIVVLDPPSYASTKRGRFSVERDYPELVAHALSVLAPRGLLLACTNHHGLDARTFTRLLQQGLARAGKSAEAIAVSPPSVDHPVENGAIPHLKASWLRVGTQGS